MKRLGRISALDGLRGVAILLVLGVHSGELIPGGRLGVDLFFVLSGFLITTLLLGEWAGEGMISLRSFYRRRAMRLLPALVCVIGAFLLAYRFHSDALLSAVLGLVYVVNIVQAVHGSELAPRGLGHLWSLGQEEQFYLLWPPLLFVALRRTWRWQAIVAGLGALAIAIGLVRADLLLLGYQFWSSWWNPVLHSDPILLGCIAGLLYANGVVTRAPAGAASALLVPAALLLAIGRPSAALYAIGLPVFGVACAVVVLTCALDGNWWFARMMDRRWLRHLGRISYGLYLWHWPIFIALGWKLGLPISIIVAEVSYRYVEQPFLRRRHSRSRRLSPLRAQEPASLERVVPDASISAT